MSGPILRKYGFPNFEKIFGPKPILHGADDGEGPKDADPGPATAREGTEPAKGGEGGRGEAGESAAR